MTARAQLPRPEPLGEATLLRDIRAVKLPEPIREHHFSLTRQWRFDFAWPDRALAVEVDGGTRTAGRHTRGDGYERDCEKLNEAVLAGWKVLRFTTEMVTDGRAVAVLERALRTIGDSARP